MKTDKILSEFSPTLHNMLNESENNANSIDYNIEKIVEKKFMDFNLMTNIYNAYEREYGIEEE